VDPAFVERVEALGERMEALGVIQRQPDYGRLFDLSFVERVVSEKNCKE
jgi:NitT/TauT family transport system substrate-binding protein